MTLFEMHALAQEITNDFEKNYVFAIMENDGVPHGHIFFDSTNRFYIEDPQNIAMLNMSDVDWEVKAVALIPIERNLFYCNFEEYTFSQMLDWITGTSGVIPYAIKKEETEDLFAIENLIDRLGYDTELQTQCLNAIGKEAIAQYLYNYIYFPSFLSCMENCVENKQEFIIELIDYIRARIV